MNKGSFEGNIFLRLAVEVTMGAEAGLTMEAPAVFRLSHQGERRPVKFMHQLSARSVPRGQKYFYL
jgi:hypothetical protein